jgi:para-aminobenzoate synthetase component 1
VGDGVAVSSPPGPEVFPLVEELTPAPDAWEVCRQLAHLPHLMFLDSAARAPELGRYSYLAADPFLWIEAHGREVKSLSLLPGGVLHIQEADPFAVLQQELRRWSLRPAEGLPPLQGGAIGVFGYDLCHHLERLPRPRFDEFRTPDLAVGLYDWVIAFDHARGRAWIFSTGLPEVGAAGRRRAADRLRDVLRQTRGAGFRSCQGPRQDWNPAPRLEALAPSFPLEGCPGVRSNFSRQGYLAAVARAVEYVHAGDCFQVNVAQRLLHPATIPPLELYAQLRACNPAPFAACCDLGDFILCSASPERFVRLAGGVVETRPIKGTRPRGTTPEGDLQQVEELLASTKDRAENVMIVDLLRNDLGRVCAYGSIHVDALCRLETFAYVHHLVSVVSGRLRPGLGPIDLLRASFPGGSVTGAPKVRAMQIIAELEPTARGPYCGCLGWIGFDGAMDTNILIRTFTIGKGWIQFPVGGGIVADSIPDAEYAETLHKAAGLLRALPQKKS